MKRDGAVAGGHAESRVPALQAERFRWCPRLWFVRPEASACAFAIWQTLHFGVRTVTKWKRCIVVQRGILSSEEKKRVKKQIPTVWSCPRGRPVKRCRRSAKHCGWHVGALPAPCLQDTSALLLTILMTSLNCSLVGSSCSLIFTMYYLFSALFRLSSALAK